jgi:hypothetical protein
MIQTVEAVIDQHGHVQLLEQVHVRGLHRALVTILEEPPAIESLAGIEESPEAVTGTQSAIDETDWLHPAVQGLAAAYAQDEPDYPVALIKEWNPAYARG